MGYSNLHELVVFILSNLSIGQEYQPWNGGHSWKFYFPNGYGLSIVKHSFSYGRGEDLWELAVLRHENGNNVQLFPDNPIVGFDTTGDDVVGWLTEKDLVAFGHKVSAL